MLIVYADALFGRWKNAVYTAITVKIPGSIATDLINLFFFGHLPMNLAEKNCNAR
jgi:hypothetical protein